MADTSPARIVVLPGDGIGPEIMAAALRVLERVGRFEVVERPIGGAAIDRDGTPLPAATFEACRAADAVLLGAVGGPKWDHLASGRPEAGLLGLREGLGLYANLRPIKPLPALYDFSPLKNERITGVDMVIVRELTGGVYFGKKNLGKTAAYDTMAYTTAEIERVGRVAFRLACERAETTKRPPRLISIDKANVLASSQLWRAIISKLGEREFEDVRLEHMLVDNAAMQLTLNPSQFDVIVTENLFGDILSDEAAAITGSIGLLPSASVGSDGPALFEPIHGSAPDIAGKGTANPLGMILSAAEMLRHLARPEDAHKIEKAVAVVLSEGTRPADLGGSCSTEEMTRAVIDRI